MDSGTLETGAEVALIKDSFDVEPSQLSTSAIKDGSTWLVSAGDLREKGLLIKRRHSRYGVFSLQSMLGIFMHDRVDDLPCQILYLDLSAGLSVTLVWHAPKRIDAIRDGKGNATSTSFIIDAA